MQGTIDGISGEPHRSQVFRLTYKGQDYQLVLLKKSLSKLDTELPISLDGIDQKIVKKGTTGFLKIDTPISILRQKSGAIYRFDIAFKVKILLYGGPQLNIQQILRMLY